MERSWTWHGSCARDGGEAIIRAAHSRVRRHWGMRAWRRFARGIGRVWAAGVTLALQFGYNLATMPS
jgi:hypothetical protein